MNGRPSSALDPLWPQRILDFAPLVGAVRLVCVDGPAGSGKTSLAGDLAVALESLVPQAGPVPVVHGDSVYEGWDVVASAPDRVEAFDLLGSRLEGWLVDAWSDGRAGRHPVWDWSVGAWGDEVEVAAAPVVVLEGVGLAGARLRRHAVLSVWVEADPGVRLARVLERDGESLRDPMTTWQVDEDLWHARDRTRESADVRVSTTS